VNAATEIVKEEIDSLRKGDRDCDYRHRQGFMAASRLGHILDAIELMLLPANPAAAEMLQRVIEIDAEISGNSHEDDFGVAEAFDRACDLLNVAARSLPFATVQPILDHLKSGDECGLRNRLAPVLERAGMPRSSVSS
jgi:hypothetical protein